MKHASRIALWLGLLGLATLFIGCASTETGSPVLGGAGVLRIDRSF
jgi:hypothetical protein